jgi:hypothetical protein
LPAGTHNLESIRGGGGGSGTTQAFPAFLQVKELLGRSSDTLTQTRHGRCSWSGTWSVLEHGGWDTGNAQRAKVNCHPRSGHKGPEVEYRHSSDLSLTSALDVGGWSTPRRGRSTPGKDPGPIVQEAGWALGLVWTGAENLASTGIRSPYRPARSESLYRLSYRGPQCTQF